MFDQVNQYSPELSDLTRKKIMLENVRGINAFFNSRLQSYCTSITLQSKDLIFLPEFLAIQDGSSFLCKLVIKD